jgi:hypothetical protein
MLDQSPCRDRQGPKLPDADDEPPPRPHIAQRHDFDLHRPPAPPRRCLRHDADAGSGLDHQANRIEADHAGTNLHHRTKPGGMFGEMPLQSAVASEAYEIAPDDVGESEFPGPSLHVAAREDQHQTVVAEWESLDRLR